MSVNTVVYFGVDAGSSSSGIVVVNGLKISLAANAKNEAVAPMIILEKGRNEHLEVIIEDMKPFSVGLTQQTIDTCKFIGKLCYILDKKKIKYHLITRYQVKKWCFDSFPGIVVPLIESRIEKKNKKNADGKLRRASYIYVNDSIVIAVMRKIYGFEKFERTDVGLKSHSWQALGVTTFHIRSLM